MEFLLFSGSPYFYKTLNLKGFVENGVFRAKALSKLSTLLSLINIQSLITVQGDKLSKKNKRTGRKSSSISVQVGKFFNKPTVGQTLLRSPIRQACHQSKLTFYHR